MSPSITEQLMKYSSSSFCDTAKYFILDTKATETYNNTHIPSVPIRVAITGRLDKMENCHLDHFYMVVNTKNVGQEFAL